MKEHFTNDVVKNYILNSFDDDVRATTVITLKNLQQNYLYFNQNHIISAKRFGSSRVVTMNNGPIYPSAMIQKLQPLIFSVQQGEAYAKLEFIELPISDNRFIIATIIAKKCSIYQPGDAYSWQIQGFNFFFINNEFIVLSRREHEIMPFYIFGIKAPEIADVLSLKPSTVASYLNRIKSKFNISHKNELIKLLCQHQHYINYCCKMIKQYL